MSSWPLLHRRNVIAVFLRVSGHASQFAGKAQVTGAFTALAGYSRPMSIVWPGELLAGLLLPSACSILSTESRHRRGPDPDRVLVTELTGTARHHARWRELAQDEQDATVTELRELAGGRASRRLVKLDLNVHKLTTKDR